MTLWLVTGGCGFIGCISAPPLSRRQRVRVLDNLSTGRRENLAPAPSCWWEMWATRRCWRAMEGVAGCFHLAAIASVERGVREWRKRTE